VREKSDFWRQNNFFAKMADRKRSDIKTDQDRVDKPYPHIISWMLDIVYFPIRITDQSKPS
jgi:hypothetical protein